AAHYDPDGPAPDDGVEHDRRGLSFDTRADGWTKLTGWLSPELTERWRTCLDTFGAPAPAVNGVRDSRTRKQRDHDGTLAAFESLMRCGDVPSNNGISCLIVVTMTREQYETGQGLARTGHGYLVPAGDALHWGGGDTAVLAVAIDSMHAVSHYGHAHRIFTEGQRRAIAARDGGCTFPGCSEPPSRCQADHVVRHEDGGPTSTDNGQLLCRYHHREHRRQGWRAVMIDGVPHWVPPAIVDPRRTPRRNTLHDIYVRPRPE
ncbi:HNH endonuclease signature motif containing protein, partial [Jatrophihabitans endophyticus]|uniref:HNH endonuclease signature motif containing protein n=1 Tax=Jatrophihabitans endophyticus TaxID=1206085 RepID=UPI0019F62183